MRVSNSIIAILASLAAVGGLTLACVDVAYPNKAFRCDPSGPSPNCPEGFFCCSDDPTSLSFLKGVESDALALPNFADNKVDGREWAEPLFAGNNNKHSHSGMCVKLNTDPQTIEGGEAGGCPIPCNPKWNNEQIGKVCGDSKSACCQTVELDEKDCVAGDDNCMRPARGVDVFGGGDKTDWSGTAHRTHQDPGGLECSKLFESDSREWKACVRRLNVADQRGFCIAPIVDESGKKERAQCPLKKAEYKDACERLNMKIQGCEGK